ncbi:50S ribosomal protein L19 [Candidatus Uhrbacteria bacterium]|nr:50S ribosomal protein L19 [Candidatus Uhrbacteria bacterium]
MADEAKTTENKAEETAAVEAPAAETAVEAAAPAEEVKDLQVLKPGMVVRVHQKIKETTPKGDERERIQIFEGTIIAKKGQDVASATITVRKVASGVGVERIFPLRLPTIAKIEVVKELRVRRAKLYFLRDTKKKLKEKKPAANKAKA